MKTIEITKETCSLCGYTYPKQKTTQVRIVYSTSPFGEDADTVYLCDRHKEEAETKYEVSNI